MDTRILSIFYNKFLTKIKKEINGLVYTVTLNEGDGGIDFNFTNPKNLSVNTNTLGGEVEVLIDSFVKFLPKKESEYVSPIFYDILKKVKVFYNGELVDNKSCEIYLSKEDIEKYKRLAKTINVFKIKNFFSPCDVTFLDVVSEDNTHIRLDLNVKLLYPELNGEFLDKEELVEFFKEAFEDHKFYDYVNDRFAGVLLDDIWGTPLLSDQDYMYTSTNVDFFDKKGDRISWWV
jgi:hypothetical protein